MGVCVLGGWGWWPSPPCTRECFAVCSNTVTGQSLLCDRCGVEELVFVHHFQNFSRPVKTTWSVQSFYLRLCHHFNTMLLQTVVLLLLCTSPGMCATLGSYKTSQMEEGGVDVVATPEEPLEPELAPDFGSNTPIDTHGADNSTEVEPEGDVSAADGAGTDRDRPSGDAPSLQTDTDKTVSGEQPSPAKQGSDITPLQTKSLNRLQAQDESGWSLISIRNSFQTMHGYFDSLVELAGGQNGVCQYRCRYGKSHSLESWWGRKKNQGVAPLPLLRVDPPSQSAVRLLVIDSMITCSLYRLLSTQDYLQLYNDFRQTVTSYLWNCTWKQRNTLDMFISSTWYHELLCKNEIPPPQENFLSLGLATSPQSQMAAAPPWWDSR